MPSISIEIVLALEEQQYLESLELELGSTVKEALLLSALKKKYPAYFEGAKIGIFGVSVAENYVLTAHDRIEIYRPLKIDPKTRRRLRSRQKNNGN
ncbi:MAG: RnfH family protein [Neisseriaceae bacterium]